MEQGFYPLPSSPGAARTYQGGGVPQRSARTYDPAPTRGHPLVSFRGDSDWAPNVPATSAESFDDVGDDLDPVDGGDVPDNIVAGDGDVGAVDASFDDYDSGDFDDVPENIHTD